MSALVNKSIQRIALRGKEALRVEWPDGKVILYRLTFNGVWLQQILPCVCPSHTLSFEDMIASAEHQGVLPL